MTNERRISSDILAKTINAFNLLKIKSTTNDSAYCESEEDDAEKYTNSDPKVATHTINGNSSHKLLIK